MMTGIGLRSVAEIVCSPLGRLNEIVCSPEPAFTALIASGSVQSPSGAF